MEDGETDQVQSEWRGRRLFLSHPLTFLPQSRATERPDRMNREKEKQSLRQVFTWGLTLISFLYSLLSFILSLKFSFSFFILLALLSSRHQFLSYLSTSIPSLDIYISIYSLLHHPLFSSLCHACSFSMSPCYSSVSRPFSGQFVSLCSVARVNRLPLAPLIHSHSTFDLSIPRGSRSEKRSYTHALTLQLLLTHTLDRNPRARTALVSSLIKCLHFF